MHQSGNKILRFFGGSLLFSFCFYLSFYWNAKCSAEKVFFTRPSLAGHSFMQSEDPRGLDKERNPKEKVQCWKDTRRGAGALMHFCPANVFPLKDHCSLPKSRKWKKTKWCKTEFKMNEETTRKKPDTFLTISLVYIFGNSVIWHQLFIVKQEWKSLF